MSQHDSMSLFESGLDTAGDRLRRDPAMCSSAFDIPQQPSVIHDKATLRDSISTRGADPLYEVYINASQVVETSNITVEEEAEFRRILRAVTSPEQCGCRYESAIRRLSSEATPSIWSRTPHDIIDYIAQELLDICNTPNRFRPRLFHCVRLPSNKDIDFFVHVLSSDLSRWLALHVQELVLGTSNRRELSNLWRSLRGPLNAILPNIRRLECCGLEAYFQADSCPSTMWPQLIGCPHALQALATIRLSGYRFYSFSVLLRQLAALHHLEVVELDNISWTVPCDSGEVSRRKWSFRALAGIFARTCSEYWPLAWIALASCFWEEADESFPLEIAKASMLCCGQLIQTLLGAHCARALSVLKLSDGSIRIMADSVGIEVDFVVGCMTPRDARSLCQIIIADYGSLVRPEEPDWALVESILSRHCAGTNLDIVYGADTSPEAFGQLSLRIPAEMRSTRVSMHHRLEEKGPIIDFIERLKGSRR